MLDENRNVWSIIENFDKNRTAPQKKPTITFDHG